MSDLELDNVVDDGLGPLSLRFSLGLSVCLGDSLPALGRLIELASGTRSPRRGRALWGGAAVRESAPARRKLIALLPDEELPNARTVEASLGITLMLRGSRSPSKAVLETWGLSRYARSDPAELAPSERRAIQLAACLCDAEASLVLLHDPLALAPLVPRQRVIQRCIELSKERAVVVTTDSLVDARALGGAAYLVERGRLSSYIGLAAHRGEVSLRVRSPEAQRLAEALRADARLHVRFDAHLTKMEFLVSGQAVELVTTAVANTALDQGIGIEALSAELPSLHLLLNARAQHFSPAPARRSRFSFGNRPA